MSFKDYTTDQNLIGRITTGIRNGSISHAYIFECDDLEYAFNFSLDFIKAILCLNEKGIGCDHCINCNKINHGNYEDLFIVESIFNQGKTVKSIRDTDIEELQVKLKNKPGLTRNIAIIKDSDTLTLRAQNRLLKTLEEPSDGTIIILLASNSQNLIDTVRSRSVIYHLNYKLYEEEDLKDEEELINMILSGSGFYEVKEKLLDMVKSRDEAFSFLDSMEKVIRNMIINDKESIRRRERLFKAVDLIEEARRDLIYKVGYTNALKNLILKI